jgi:hypothetical protein
MSCPSEVTVVTRGIVTEPVLEGGIAPVEPAVLSFWNVSAFCAVTRTGSKREKRLVIQSIVKERIPR